MRRRSTAAAVMAAITSSAALLAAALSVAALPLLTAGSAAAATIPAAAAGPAAATGVAEHIAITTRDADSDKAQVKATGVFKAKGTAHTGALSGGKATDWLIFKYGSVRLVTYQTSSWASVPNPSSCKFTEVFHGTYAIHGGTRHYASATGSGHYLAKIWGRLKKEKGSCTDTLASFYEGTWAWGSMHW
jgi:hypothetical protein